MFLHPFFDLSRGRDLHAFASCCRSRLVAATWLEDRPLKTQDYSRSTSQSKPDTHQHYCSKNQTWYPHNIMISYDIALFLSLYLRFFLVKWPFLPCHHPSHEKIKIPMIWSWPAHETIWNTMKSPPNPRGNGVHSAWASRMPGHSWKHWRSRLVRPLAFGIHHGFGLNTWMELIELIELIESIESIANRFIVIACYS